MSSEGQPDLEEAQDSPVIHSLGVAAQKGSGISRSRSHGGIPVNLRVVRLGSNSGANAGAEEIRSHRDAIWAMGVGLLNHLGRILLVDHWMIDKSSFIYFPLYRL